MSKIPKKVMVLGIDSAIAARVYQAAKEGKLPTLRRLMDAGVYATNCFVPNPTVTPPNWTSITTGAWPGTHGITGFSVQFEGEPLYPARQGLDARYVTAERVWTAARRAGKKAIVVNYPTTWPPTPGVDYQVAGYGLAVNDYRIGLFYPDGKVTNLCHDILLASEAYPHATEVVFEKAHGWDGLTPSARALEATVQPEIREPMHRLKPFTWHLLLDSSTGGALDTVIVAREKSAAGVFARLKVGEWSPHIYDTFETEKGPRKGVFRCKLLELSPDGLQFRLYVPCICGLQGWGYPEAIEDEIRSEDGLPMGRAGWEPYTWDWIDSQTLIETTELYCTWLADTSLHLLRNKPWDIFFIHEHSIDWAYHVLSDNIDPLTAVDPSLVETMQALEVALYQVIDRCFGRILEVADEDTVVVIVSDHGCKSLGIPFPVNDALEKAGLLVYLPSTDEDEPREVDWSKTRAIWQRSGGYICINVKGRDPQGIVEPEDYERTVDEVIKVLHQAVDPETGLRPIAIALRKEDAPVLGLWGDRVGDIFYNVDPRFEEEHAYHLSTAHYGVGDLKGMFIMAGPGVKQGEVLDRNVHLTDIVPTICHLARLPVPTECEGAILYHALEDPGAPLREMQSLRSSVNRYRRVLKRPVKL
ncbi:MAG: alkaline phosphatase family protein [Chloroflexi bacterium]|nr:alkaline phosphatase family protein [Chloroflexota bacterium]